ncbi:IPExxxVDY family protein [Flavobacteriaceae bacterium S356]|uniref:IPExxxVDY family protein n=1 Tax=Asprobacillus argus TaxID=3076534 RepID=A0ABU3LCJ3_9FLAO|nr:IPExxxVDY family protein [Flavobacteriaceae bacterium S356]
MQVHALDLNDFCEENYTLIGVHTTLEDYKLAFLLNSHLKTGFHRASYSLDFSNTAEDVSFSIYDYTNKEYDFEWYLIANSCSQEVKLNSSGLLQSTETKTYLIKEKKKVDFFIKIVGETDRSYITKTIDKINAINQVVTSYQVDTNTLKSKDFLIF